MEGYKIDGVNLQRLKASFEEVKSDVLLNAISDPDKLNKLYECLELAIYEMGTMYGSGYAKGIEDATGIKNKFAIEYIPEMQEYRDKLLNEGFTDNWGDGASCKDGIVVGLLRKINSHNTEYCLLSTTRVVKIQHENQHGNYSA